jgi:hypothetical protein
MHRATDEVQGTRCAAIFASVVMCLTAASASARVQTSATSTSASNAAAAKSAPDSGAHPEANSTPSSATANKGTRGSEQHTAATHKNASRSSSAKTSRTSPAGSAGHRPTRASSQKSKSTKSKSSRLRGQQKIDSARATSIQEALIREHYLGGEPSGVWDTESETAMRRYQSDHGWQTKEVPDSRALIKLGLGPNNAHLLNPESAMTSAPITPTSNPSSPSSHSPSAADPAGTNGDNHPVDKPAAPPQAAPAVQPDPATPHKDSDDSGKPQ